MLPVNLNQVFSNVQLPAACLNLAMNLIGYSNLYKEDHFLPGKILNYVKRHTGAVEAGFPRTHGFHIHGVALKLIIRSSAEMEADLYIKV